MRSSVGVPLAGIVLAAAACLPPEPPFWLIDHPVDFGIRASVVVPGGYSSGLIVPDGQVRAAPLPLDTIELERLYAGPPGTVLPPPIWVACQGACTLELSRLGGALADCPELLPLSLEDPCRLGEGERLQVVLDGAFSAGPEFTGAISLLTVSGGADLPSETCLERLLASPRAGLERCLIGARMLRLGPPAKLWSALPETVPTPIPRDELPPGALLEPADTHPVITGFSVTRETDAGAVALVAADGDTVPVRAGEGIDVEVLFDDHAEQDHLDLVADEADPERLVLAPVREALRSRMALTAHVDGLERGFYEHAARWVAPDSPAPVVLFVYVADGREGRAFATLRFVTEDAASPP